MFQRFNSLKVQCYQAIGFKWTQPAPLQRGRGHQTAQDEEGEESRVARDNPADRRAAPGAAGVEVLRQWGPKAVQVHQLERGKAVQVEIRLERRDESVRFQLLESKSAFK